MLKYQKTLLCILIFSAMLFSGIQNATAQEKNESKYAFKAYLNANPYFNDKSGAQAGLLSAAISRKSKFGNFMEFELSELEASSYNTAFHTVPSLSPAVIHHKQYLKLRYEVAIALLKNKKVIPFLGASFSPYLLRTTTRPFVSPPVPTAHQKYGLTIALVPRIQWNISSRCFLDLNTPVALIDGYFVRNVVRNPAFTAGQQTEGFAQAEFAADLSIRFGLGIRL